MTPADQLIRTHDLPDDALYTLLAERDDALRAYLADAARAQCLAVYGADVFIRGLIEFTNYCRNNCYYCGIRHDNRNVERYRLDKARILACCDEGYALGFRTFVLQGGEDPYFTDARLTDVVAAIHARFPDCAITLSVGERNAASYQALYDAGANRYLLRHETATESHYRQLHPPAMDFTHRMHCLQQLKAIGYQVGCGFMVGSPGQTLADLVRDLRFIRTFRPHMVGIGPFLPHQDTPFRAEPGGSVELTLYLLSIIRLLLPETLLPATTALGTAADDGRERGILAGANVVMPNLSPLAVRRQYMLYDNKISTGDESAQSVKHLAQRIAAIGGRVVTARGDSRMHEQAASRTARQAEKR